MTRRANAAYVRKDPEVWKFEGSTSVPNSITRDPDIPPDECWAWTWLCSHTEEFEVSGEKLWKAKKGLSKNRAYELLSSLERRGLLLRYHAFDHESRVPYIDYQLQPKPAPEDQRTWTPSKAAPRTRGPHPGSRAARAARDRELAGLVAAATQEDVDQPGRIPDRAGIRPDQDFPDRTGARVDSRPAGNRQGGSPYKDEKTITVKPSLPPSPPTRLVPQSERASDEPSTTKTPSAEAMDMILGLRWPGPRKLGQKHANELAGLADAMADDGYVWADVARHVRSVLAEAKSNPLSYLRTGLKPEHWPARTPVSAPPPECVVPVADSFTSESTSSPEVRARARAEVAAALEGRGCRTKPDRMHRRHSAVPGPENQPGQQRTAPAPVPVTASAGAR